MTQPITYIQCAECGTWSASLDGHVHRDPARCIPSCAIDFAPSPDGTTVACPRCGDLWTLKDHGWNRTRLP